MTDTVTINPGSSPDLAAAINAALADPTVTTVVLTVGEFLLHSSIIVPSGKTLVGAGRDQTVLRAAADFQIIDQSNNAVVISQPNATNITLSDFAVDAAKISPDGLRLNGVFMKHATDFAITRVDVSNATGYAHFAQGDLGSFQAGNPYVMASGTYDDIRTFNSQVHFEQIFADGITLTNVHARDGDGDISTEAYFHPVVGSSNITYIDSSARGAGFLGFSLISSSIPLSNITIINTQVEVLAPSQGSALIALGNLPVNGLHIIDSSFIAHNYIAFRIGGVTGSATGSYFQGGAFAVEVTTSGNGSPSDFAVTDSTALGLRDPASGFGVAGAHSDQASYLSWDGGVIESRAQVMIPVSGAIDLSPTTQIISAGFDAALAYQEEGPAVRPFADEDWTLPANTNLAGALLRVEHLAFDTAEDELALATNAALVLNAGVLTLDGRVVATVTGGTLGSDLLIRFNAAATAADAQSVLEAITYRSTADDPATSYTRLIDARLTLADSTYDRLGAAVSLEPIDDASLIEPSATTELTYNEQSAPILLLPDAALSDVDSTDLTGSTLTIKITAGYDPADQLAIIAGAANPTGIVRAGQSLFFNGAAFGVVANSGTNGEFRVLLGNGSSLAAVEALVRSIGYSYGGDLQTTESRNLSVQLTNSAGRAEVPVQISLTLQPVLMPITGIGDAAAVVETGMVEIAALANDLNPDGAVETIVAIDGQAIAPGGSVTLVSGAVVTLLANGELRYDPAGAFAHLAAALTGTILASAQDSFSYALTGGGAATVTVTITGENTGGETILGDAASNILLAGLNLQLLDGMGGSDVLDDAGLEVRLRGGSGDDTYLIANGSTTIKELAGEGHDRVITTLGSFTLSDQVEDLTFAGPATTRFYGYGNGANNTIIAGQAADFLFGYAGDDRLLGGNGADYLDGGNGHDLIDGGTGADVMYGGKGNDLFFVDHLGDLVFEYADGGADTVNVQLSHYTLPTQVENANFAGSGDAMLTGNSLGNRLLGSSWNDTLIGLDGDDTLAGFAGNDVLDGGAGNDLLIAGYGNDLLTGGTGADKFRFDTALSAGNVGTITDFEAGIDRIELNRSIFGAVDPGVLAATAFETGTSATSVDTRIVYDPATGSIYYDADGSGAGGMVLFAVLSPGTALSAGDFFGY